AGTLRREGPPPARAGRPDRAEKDLSDVTRHEDGPRGMCQARPSDPNTVRTDAPQYHQRPGRPAPPVPPSIEAAGRRA
ncbi:hypothetical protein ABTK11_22650, partial [Acinetobacter baumannii]